MTPTPQKNSSLVAKQLSATPLLYPPRGPRRRPDQEVVVLSTGANTLVTMTKDWARPTARRRRKAAKSRTGCCVWPSGRENGTHNPHKEHPHHNGLPLHVSPV